MRTGPEVTTGAARSSVAFGLDVALVVLLILIMTDTLRHVIPDELAPHVERNSEGFLLALITIWWLRYARSRWPSAVLGAVACTALSFGLLATNWTNRVRTLNEALFSAAALMLYLAVARPLPRWLPLAISGSALATMLAIGWSALGRQQAETITTLMLVPLLFDLVERQTLEPEAPTPPNVVRVGWYAIVAACPIVVQALDDRLTAGMAGSLLQYASQTTEAFVFVLLVGVFIHLPEPWRTRTPHRSNSRAPRVAQ